MIKITYIYQTITCQFYPWKWWLIKTGQVYENWIQAKHSHCCIKFPIGKV